MSARERRYSSPKREIKTRDELGFLTQSFNAMTRQLSEAR
ncbi:HAMP domain-containing protein, partial [Ralstonia pickettii]|nr:HAMP domain-containing protein [Ralstonia pickettii]